MSTQRRRQQRRRQHQRLLARAFALPAPERTPALTPSEPMWIAVTSDASADSGASADADATADFRSQHLRQPASDASADFSASDRRQHPTPAPDASIDASTDAEHPTPATDASINASTDASADAVSTPVFNASVDTSTDASANSFALVLEAHHQQVVLLKTVVDTLTEFFTEVNFDCSEKGIQVQSMDSSLTALVSLLLRKCAFADFKCDRPMSLGMHVDSLSRVFQNCGPNHSLKLKWQNNADTLHIRYDNSKGDCIADFDLKLMQIERGHSEIPELQYEVVARLPSGEFQKICKDLREFGDTIQMSASKEGIKFSVAGNVGSGNVMLTPRDAAEPADKVTLTVHEPVTATFALCYLVNFTKAAPLGEVIELGLGHAPLLVRYELARADNGFTQLHLLPDAIL